MTHFLPGLHNEKYVFFCTNESHFSNHYRCRIEDPITGLSFHSSEQFYMYEKAMEFRDEESARAIMRTPSPGYTKTFGKHVRGFKRWK
ncbi:hypothetical protein PMAYCL1PPCAC_12935, partial [Pristionchus mayeri]